MKKNENDELLEIINSNGFNIHVYKTLNQEFYGSINKNEKAIHKTSNHSLVDNIPILCRVWLINNVKN